MCAHMYAHTHKDSDEQGGIAFKKKDDVAA